LTLDPNLDSFLALLQQAFRSAGSPINLGNLKALGSWPLVNEEGNVLSTTDIVELADTGELLTLYRNAVTGKPGTVTADATCSKMQATLLRLLEQEATEVGGWGPGRDACHRANNSYRLGMTRGPLGTGGLRDLVMRDALYRSGGKAPSEGVASGQ